MHPALALLTAFCSLQSLCLDQLESPALGIGQPKDSESESTDRQQDMIGRDMPVVRYPLWLDSILQASAKGEKIRDNPECEERKANYLG
jgi:hypothetical protein